jgi:hypothetical protein
MPLIQLGTVLLVKSCASEAITITLPVAMALAITPVDIVVQMGERAVYAPTRAANMLAR